MNAITLKNAEALSIEIMPEAQRVKADALAVAKPIVAIASAQDQQIAVNALRSLQQLCKLVESSRTDVKAPVLAIGRRIDDEAKKFVADVDAEAKRLNRLITSYTIEQQQKAEEAERARRAELARIEEEKRKAAQAEAAQLAELARIEEEKRLAIENEFMAETPQDAKAYAAASQSSALVAEKLKQQAAEERARQDELARQAAVASASVVRTPAKAVGQVVRKVPRFEVTDISVLYAARPNLVRIEPNASAINGVLSSGVREVPGLRIWEEVQTQVR